MRPFLLMALAALITGCAGDPPRDPDYAPAMPEVAVPPAPVDGAVYQAGYGMSLFEDRRAHNVGDILTVVLVEKTDATKQASTSTNKSQTINTGAPTLLGAPVLLGGAQILNNSVDASRSFAGDGASSQSNSLTGNISVTVTQVLPNGNLVIRGEKLLTLNQGDEFIRIQGIVRPADILPTNTIDSTKIANSQITYSGKGAINDANRQGWLARFFNSPLWPF